MNQQNIDIPVSEKKIEKSWRQSMRAWGHPRVVTMLFFGVSAGLPYWLIFSTLSLWLLEAGVSRSAVTFFSWAALGYSFKFIWAPLVDTLPLPFLTKKLGRRRGWLLVAQAAVITAICIMALTDPAVGEQNLVIMALAAVMLGFSSATQDIVIDAYKIECAEQDMQALLSSAYLVGYRVGLLTAGAGALYLAAWFGTSMEVYSYAAWQYSYLSMAAVMLIGMGTTLLIPEPKIMQKNYEYSATHYLRIILMFVCTVGCFVGVFFLTNDLVAGWKTSFAASFGGHDKLIAFILETVRLAVAVFCGLGVAFILAALNIADRDMVRQTYINPIMDFFNRYGIHTAILLLTLIGFYRISDMVLGMIANVFYLELGFSKEVIAGVTKTFGLFMTLIGGFLGGMLTVRYGVMKILFLGALLSSVTNLLFMLLADAGNNIQLLYIVISADNLSAGIATTAFLAFLASLTNITFTAMQYAVFSSLMTLLPKVIGGYSGTMSTAWGYQSFFLVTALMGVPVLVLVWLAGRRLR
jgi:PAT family beta-lactamase induction signal transducer AmpG